MKIVPFCVLMTLIALSACNEKESSLNLSSFLGYEFGSSEEAAEKFTDSLKRQGIISSTPYPNRGNSYKFLKADGNQVGTRFNIYYDNEFLYRIVLEFGSYQQWYSGWEFNSSVRTEDIQSIFLTFQEKYGEPEEVSVIKEDLDGNYDNFKAFQWALENSKVIFFKGFEKESSVTSYTNGQKIWFTEKASIEYELDQGIIDKWNLEKYNDKLDEI